MNIQRRDFLKTSLAASATAALATQAQAASGSSASNREYYELRCYHLKADTRLKANAAQAALDGYLQNAFLPALGKRGVKNVGAFTELEVNKSAGTSNPKADSPLWVLIPHASLESFVAVSADLNEDAAVKKAGAAYLNLEKGTPPFERVDTWLLRAFKSMPRMEIPAFAKNKVPTRVFEMRTYESYSEDKALRKMAMFDDGETQVMRDLDMGPLFFGQAVAGKNLPHLTYITSGRDLAAHLANWKKFPTAPGWVKMKDDPKYKDTVSKNIPFFLVPTSYSQI
jgi:hypothetical protein